MRKRIGVTADRQTYGQITPDSYAGCILYSRSFGQTRRMCREIPQACVDKEDYQIFQTHSSFEILSIPILPVYWIETKLITHKSAQKLVRSPSRRRTSE